MKTFKQIFSAALSLALILSCVMTVPVAHADELPPEFEWSIPEVGSEEVEFDYPLAIAIDSLGNIYVSDTGGGNYRIRKFDPDGNFILQWGEEGSGDGQFDYSEDIAIDSNDRVYLLDSINSRVQIFDTDGNFISKWGAFGDGEGQINYGLTIDIDSSDNVYIYDNGATERIQKFDSAGNFILTWGAYGDGEGEFEYAEGLAIDAENNVYVADTSLNRIQKFDSSGNFILQWGDENFSPSSIATDTEGNVYALNTANEESYRVQKFDSSGNFILEWGESGTGEGQFDYSEGIAVDDEGNVYVADSQNNRVQKFSAPESEPEPEPEPEDDEEDNAGRTRTRRSGSVVYCNPPERVTFCRMREGTTTVTDLQSQIDAIMAELRALESTSGPLPVRDLTLGMEGEDVKVLQDFLIVQGHSIPAGATGYFGMQTQTALASYQQKVGITPASGYFGSITRTYLTSIGAQL